MRHTLAINAQARESLISAEGFIESGFTPGKYSTEIACAAYRDWWRFDLEDLHEDLIRRGMAVLDEIKPHGLRQLIEDYPYANDGLLIWSAIQELVQAYVTHFYPNENDVISDTELQSWYNEAINVGHADVLEANWWPKLCTPSKLTEILTILIWTSSAQHAALNFGQYHFGGYVPKRPPLMRKLIPQQYDLEHASFIADPEGYFLASLPSLFKSTRYMAAIDINSAHSQEEEYLGEIKDACTSWPGEPKIIKVFYRFSMTMKNIENEIKRRNIDPRLRNRCGAGVLPYELLVPTSEPGVTGRDCEACNSKCVGECGGECGGEFGGESCKHCCGGIIGVDREKALGFAEKNGRCIENNDRGIEKNCQGIEKNGWITVLRVMGSSN
ncbi:lipoxygenase 3, chloroplastic-like protein [Tanacetum coccineum]